MLRSIAFVRSATSSSFMTIMDRDRRRKERYPPSTLPASNPASSRSSATYRLLFPVWQSTQTGLSFGIAARSFPTFTPSSQAFPSPIVPDSMSASSGFSRYSTSLSSGIFNAASMDPFLYSSAGRMSMIVRSNVLPLISSAAVIVLIILFLFSIYGCRPDPGAVSCCFYFSKIFFNI